MVLKSILKLTQRVISWSCTQISSKNSTKGALSGKTTLMANVTTFTLSGLARKPSRKVNCFSPWKCATFSSGSVKTTYTSCKVDPFCTGSGVMKSSAQSAVLPSWPQTPKTSPESSKTFRIRLTMPARTLSGSKAWFTWMIPMLSTA